MVVQFITTPHGDEMAVLPRADFEALIEAVEDAEDNAAAEATLAAYHAGEIEAFPSELVWALSDGANPVRTFRDHRGLTAEALAATAGISRAYLSQIEAGSRTGTTATLKKLAAALRVDLELLVWDRTQMAETA